MNCQASKYGAKLLEICKISMSSHQQYCMWQKRWPIMQDDHEPFQMYAGYLLLYMHPCRSYRWTACASSVKIFAYKKWQNLFLRLLITPKTYGFAHLRHTSALVHWPILHNIILLQCTCRCICYACTVYTRGQFVPEQKTEPIFNLGHCSWKLKQLIMKVVVDYAIGSISHHYTMSEALNSFWQRYCIWYPSITYNSVAMEIDIFWCEWPLMIFSGDLSHRSIQVYMYVLSLFICKFVSRKWGYFFQ